MGRFVRDLTLTDFPFLASLAASESAYDRRIWLRVAIDHFVAAELKDPDAIERFSDIIALQLDSADAATRLEIARKLAPCARTPARLLAKFESANFEASEYMLERAVAYTDHDLAQAVARGGRHAIAVAKRKNVGPKSSARLAAQNEVDVLIALASNGSARLEGGMLVDLLLRARWLAEQEGDRRLADSLLQRRPVAPESAALFLCAKPKQRVDILLAAQRLQLGRARLSGSDPAGVARRTGAGRDCSKAGTFRRHPCRGARLRARTCAADRRRRFRRTFGGRARRPRRRQRGACAGADFQRSVGGRKLSADPGSRPS